MVMVVGGGARVSRGGTFEMEFSLSFELETLTTKY